MNKYLKYVPLLLIFFYGVIGLIYAGNQANIYRVSGCSNSLTNYVTGSSLLYLSLSLGICCATYYAAQKNRHFDIIEILNEHNFVNLSIFIGTLAFIFWGVIEMFISNCVSYMDVYHVGFGLVIIQTCSLIVQIMYTRSSLKISFIKLTNRCVSKTNASHYSEV